MALLCRLIYTLPYHRVSSDAFPAKTFNEITVVSGLDCRKYGVTIVYMCMCFIGHLFSHFLQRRPRRVYIVVLIGCFMHVCTVNLQAQLNQNFAAVSLSKEVNKLPSLMEDE